MEENKSEVSEEEIQFPGFTEWKRTRCCCFKNAIDIGVDGVTYLGHWQVQLGMPITVNIIIITSYIIAISLIIPSFHSFFTSSINTILLSILYFLFTYSYFRVIIDGPGYLPFYWPDKEIVEPVPNESETTSLLHISDDLSPAGIISNDEQAKWTKTRPRPNRCILSSFARRYVIRPDHVCGWTTSWIGKRNHKFFLLFNFWGFIYISYFLTLDLIGIIKEFKTEDPSLFIVLYLIYTFLALLFMVLTGSFVFSHFYGAFINQTSWEEWQKFKENQYDKGCVRNIEDVFGPIKYWYLFFCPVSPWKDMSNDELIRNYESGYGNIERI